MQQQSIEYHQKSSLHRPWPFSWSNQVSQAHPDSYIPTNMLPQKCSCSDFQISDIFLALFAIDLLFSRFHRFIVFCRYKDEGLKDRIMSIAGGRWFEETKSAACSHTRSVLQSRECFPSGNDDEVAACRALRTLYCATVNLSSLSYFDISQKPPGQKGSFIRQPQPSTETCYLQKHHQSPAHLPFGPKKREKNRGMPHLEEESPRTWAAAIVIGREKIPPKKNDKQRTKHEYERETERQRESKRESAEGLTHSHYCLSRLDTLAWPFFALSRSWNELLLFYSAPAKNLHFLLMIYRLRRLLRPPQLASFNISNPSSLAFIASATPTVKNKQANKQTNQKQKAAQ
jgi:hypothetical protein